MSEFNWTEAEYVVRITQIDNTPGWETYRDNEHKFDNPEHAANFFNMAIKASTTFSADLLLMVEDADVDFVRNCGYTIMEFRSEQSFGAGTGINAMAFQMLAQGWLFNKQREQAANREWNEKFRRDAENREAELNK